MLWLKVGLWLKVPWSRYKQSFTAFQHFDCFHLRIFYSCVWIFQSTLHECFVYCEEREATSYSDGGASTEDALWIPYSRVNLQEPHIEREMWNIFSELSRLLEERMFPCCQIHKTGLMNLVVDLQNVLFIQVFLIPPTPLYLQKNSKSLIGWKLLLLYKNHLKLAIVLQQSQGYWRTHRHAYFGICHTDILLSSLLASLS